MLSISAHFNIFVAQIRFILYLFHLLWSDDTLHIQYFLDTSSSPRGLRVTLNAHNFKPHSNLFVQGLFGVRKLQGKECIYIQSSTQSFKDSDTVFIELDLTLESTTYEYCARAILNGRERTIVDGGS